MQRIFRHFSGACLYLRAFVCTAFMCFHASIQGTLPSHLIWKCGGATGTTAGMMISRSCMTTVLFDPDTVQQDIPCNVGKSVMLCKQGLRRVIFCVFYGCVLIDILQDVLSLLALPNLKHLRMSAIAAVHVFTWRTTVSNMPALS